MKLTLLGTGKIDQPHGHGDYAADDSNFLGVGKPPGF
jgi:hypothetical protein